MEEGVAGERAAGLFLVGGVVGGGGAAVVALAGEGSAEDVLRLGGVDAGAGRPGGERVRNASYQASCY